MNADLQAVQDKAWDLKDACDDLAARKLSANDIATLQSVKRDLGRLEAKLVGIRDKRKRGGSDDDAEHTGEQQPLLSGGANASS